MNKLKSLAVLLICLSVVVIPGCQYLPPMPIFTQTVPVITTEIPTELTAAANRILPATVIVDTPSATGTGWIYDSSGVIVTNYHVIQGERTIVVTLHGGQQFNVRSTATDPVGDLAILRINATGLPAATIGTSSSLRIGDPVVAVGNSLGEGISVKTGVVTNLNMTVGIENAQYYGLIENNAPIQEGDSGGPLVNKAGEVVGISNAKVIGLQDIAYAINIDSAKPILEDLVKNGTVTRAYLGVSARDNSNGNGAFLEVVTPGGPADQAGLQSGDVILAVNGAAIAGRDDLVQAIRSFQVGQKITITYRRGTTQSQAVATLVQYPAM